MPADASLAKVAAVRGFGGTVRLGGDSVDDCVARARERADQTGAVFVHPFDDAEIVAGQATLGLELLEDVADIATVIVPVGGGGLISGVAGVVKAARPGVRIDRRAGRGLRRLPASLARGEPVESPAARRSPTASRSSARASSRCRSSREWVDELVVVAEDDVAEAIVVLLERAKLVVEGAGAVGVAALLSRRGRAGGQRRDRRRALRRQRRRRRARHASRSGTRPPRAGGCASSRASRTGRAGSRGC